MRFLRKCFRQRNERRIISFSMKKDNIMDQAGCFGNTLAFLVLRRPVGGKNRLKAEQAWFLSEAERRAKPETEQLLTRWGKSCVFLNPRPEHFFKRFSQSSILIHLYSSQTNFGSCHRIGDTFE